MSQREAVCVRCGTFRARHDQICPNCGLQPEGDGLLVAWLLSSAHLERAQLDKVAQRVSNGEVIRPTEKMLEKARKALKSDFSTDPGLTARQRMGLLATSLLLTPLVGWTIWVFWRRTRPRAAFQALALSAPASVLLFVAVMWLRYT